MILKNLLDKDDIIQFLEEFKGIFGGILFITDNLGGIIGRGCADRGLELCSQCPRIDFQIASPIDIDGMVLGDVVFCVPPKGPVGKIEITPENLKLIARMIAELARGERDILSLSEEINTNYEILNLFYEIGEVIATALEKEKACRKILEKVGRVIGASVGCMLLRESKEIDFALATSYGVEERLIKGLTLRFGQGMVGKTISFGKATILANIDPTIPLTKIETFFPPPSLIAPMKGEEDKIIGAIILAKKEEDKEFTAGDLKLIQAIAIQISAVVRNIFLFRDLKEFFFTTVRVLAATMDARDPYTAGHSERVAEYSVAVAEELGLNSDKIEQIQLAALLHDIGMLTVPEEILHHPEELSEEERGIIKTHPFRGVQIINQIKQFEEILPGIWHHHEYYNGGGYPAGLAGEDIPISGRIIAVADAFDAMISDRSYRKALSVRAALVEMTENAGSQFDPQVVDAFKKAYEKTSEKRELPESEKKRLTY